MIKSKTRDYDNIPPIRVRVRVRVMGHTYPPMGSTEALVRVRVRVRVRVIGDFEGVDT